MRKPSSATTFSALLLMLVLSGLDQTILSTLLPSIVSALHDGDLAPWVFSAYLMASCIVIPLYGKFADRFGPARLLILASTLFTMGSVACAMASDMPSLIAARAFKGLGGGGIMTLAMLVATTVYPASERARRVGLLGAAFGISMMLGPLIGGLLLEVATWRWVFICTVPFAILSLAVLARSPMDRPKPLQRKLDIAGILMLSGGLLALVMATRRQSAYALSFMSAERAAWIVLAMTLLASLVMISRRAEDPILPFSLFRSASFNAVATMSTASGVTLFGAIVFLPAYLQQGLHMNAVVSALHTVPLMFGVVVGALLSGAMLRAGVAPRRLASTASISLVFGFSLLALTLHFARDLHIAIGLCQIPAGLGLGVLLPILSTTAQRCAGAEMAGSALAISTMLRSLGGALGVALLGDGLRQHMAKAIMAGFIREGQIAAEMADAVGDISLLLACAGLVSLAASRWLPSRFPIAPSQVPA